MLPGLSAGAAWHWHPVAVASLVLSRPFVEGRTTRRVVPIPDQSLLILCPAPSGSFLEVKWIPEWHI